MADKVGGANNQQRFKDLGNGSWAPVIAIGASDVAQGVDVQALYRTQVVLTSAVLAASGSYISAAIDALNFRRITGRCISNIVAASFSLEQSDDAVTWDTCLYVAPAANTIEKFDMPIYLRYVRFVYTNTATAQTYFRLSAYLAAA